MWAFYLTKENKKGNTEYTDYDIEDITYMAARRHEIFSLLYINNGVLGDFPKIFDHFLKISKNSPKVVRKPDERFRTLSRNVRRLPKTSEEDPKMLRSYNSKFKCS